MAGELLRVGLPLTSLQMKERHSQVPDLPSQVSPNIGRVSIYCFLTSVCVHMWACVLSERMLFGQSSTVLIFRVGSSLLGTTVKN